MKIVADNVVEQTSLLREELTALGYGEKSYRSGGVTFSHPDWPGILVISAHAKKHNKCKFIKDYGTQGIRVDGRIPSGRQSQRWYRGRDSARNIKKALERVKELRQFTTR